MVWNSNTHKNNIHYNNMESICYIDLNIPYIREYDEIIRHSICLR